MADQGGRLPEMPNFEDFYRAVNQREPFPWQARLAQHVGEHGTWPAEIGVPTGLGKTACLDIAVWSLASQAHLSASERPAPTRIWWVVNRRLLVDEASKHAQRLDQMLREPDQAERDSRDRDVLRHVAARLTSLAAPPGGVTPLYVIPMRGGLALRRPPNPAQPSIIVSTIPMFGSRLLFRGFGSSRSMRPIDAALAGTDSLVIVDEAHLARHLRDLIPKLEECVTRALTVLPARRNAPQVVSLTATGDTPPEGRFEIKEDDLANEVIRQRLDAAKPVEVDAESRGDAAKALRDAAVRLLTDAASPAACVIFCNTPGVARDVHNLIRSERVAADAATMLVTGRTRQTDADRLKDQLLSPSVGAPASVRDRSSQPRRERHLIVVATQTLEVGADLDFEYLVTEQCGVRSLTQRLGRLNRMGCHPHARAAYVHRSPPRRPRGSADEVGSADGESGERWPVYGSEPTAVRERLDKLGLANQLDLSPGVIAQRLGEPCEDPGRAPEVLPEILWEWVKTTTPPHGEAPVEPYFSGISEPHRSVSVIWRCHVPRPAAYRRAVEDETHELEVADEQHRLWPRVSHDETVEIPLHELREALDACGLDRVIRRSSNTDFLQAAELSDLRPSDLVVLPTDIGLYDQFGWAPDSTKPVTDLSIERSGLPLDREAIERLLTTGSGKLDSQLVRALSEVLDDDEDEPDGFLAREAAQRLIALLRTHDMAGLEPDDWQSFLDALDPTPVRTPNEVPRLELPVESTTARIDESDEVSLCNSLPPEAMELVAHGEAVSTRSAQLAKALGISAQLTDMVQTSGQLHDIGKADRRFQRWLNPDRNSAESDCSLLAKSNMTRSEWPLARRNAGWPSGGRHEELSARLVRSWLADGTHGLEPEDQDLLIHLVVSHHGKGRPLVVPVSDGSVEPVDWSFPDGTSVSVCSDLAQTDWSQPARFRRLNDRIGPWGLALLEAIVRQADHEVSAGSRPASSPADDRSEVQ